MDLFHPQGVTYMHQMTRILRIPVLTAALLLGSIIVNAQDATPIAAGDTFSGILSDTVSNFSYDLTHSATPMLITATSSEFTPTLGLALSGGQAGSFRVSFDGDVGNPLFIPPLPEGTTAQVQVTSNQIPAKGYF